MNKVLPWVKSNWLIVALMAVALIALPVMLYFSTRMNTNLVTQTERRVKDDFDQLRNPQITYAIPAPRPGAQRLEFQGAPNAVVTSWFAERYNEMAQQSREVWDAALAHNRAGHEVLVPGLFPEPARGDIPRLQVRFAEEYMARVPGMLLERARAGMPPPPEALAAQLAEARERRFEQQRVAQGTSELTGEEMAAVNEEMRQLRLDRYRRRASEIGVYADRDVFADIPPPPAGGIPVVPVRQCFEWQMNTWLLTDLMSAVAVANGQEPGSAGAPSGGVANSVVKRILSVQVSPLLPRGDRPSRNPNDPFGGMGGMGGMPMGTQAEGVVPTDPMVSLTGRTGGEANQFYDVRTVEVQLVASAPRLVQFVEALKAVNFMTVLDVDLAEVDVWEHLGQGFYYGEEPVVQAAMTIETIWFRDWTRPLMPPSVKEDLQVVTPESTDPTDPT